jgi:DNA integrity scanning protein DisA with diadenylate cyclase activity
LITENKLLKNIANQATETLNRYKYKYRDDFKEFTNVSLSKQI